mgnify:CR=1 FL=1
MVLSAVAVAVAAAAAAAAFFLAAATATAGPDSIDPAVASDATVHLASIVASLPAASAPITANTWCAFVARLEKCAGKLHNLGGAPFNPHFTHANLARAP